jgi:hypothetical protein
VTLNYAFRPAVVCGEICFLEIGHDRYQKISTFETSYNSYEMLDKVIAENHPKHRFSSYVNKN